MKVWVQCFGFDINGWRWSKPLPGSHHRGFGGIARAGEWPANVGAAQGGQRRPAR